MCQFGTQSGAQNDMASMRRPDKCEKASSTLVDCLHSDICKVAKSNNGTTAAPEIVGWIQSDMSAVVRADMRQNAPWWMFVGSLLQTSPPTRQRILNTQKRCRKAESKIKSGG